MLAASPAVRITEKPVDSGYPADARAFEIEGADFAAVARGFAAHQIIAYQFVRQQVSLEQAYMELTHGHARYVAAQPAQQPQNGGARSAQPSRPNAMPRTGPYTR